jgi:hypothetical protein
MSQSGKKRNSDLWNVKIDIENVDEFEEGQNMTSLPQAMAIKESRLAKSENLPQKNNLDNST